ncbi:MAG: hypothetical protein HC906_19855 [Bacteroidales bacterium]|nr:hypothetical protein [Bacteroidales bacterium]
MTRIASYNVENLFARAKALNKTTWDEGKPILDAYNQINTLFNKNTYSAVDKTKMIELMVFLEIYTTNNQGKIRRKESVSPKWAIFRKTVANLTGSHKTRIKTLK